MIVNRSSSFSSSEQNVWSWYNLHASPSWSLYLTRPQLSAMRTNTISGNSQDTITGNSQYTPGGPDRSHTLHFSAMSPPLSADSRWPVGGRRNSASGQREVRKNCLNFMLRVQERSFLGGFASIGKRRTDDRVRTNMDAASSGNLLQLWLVVLSTTCHSGGWGRGCWVPQLVLGSSLG